MKTLLEYPFVLAAESNEFDLLLELKLNPSLAEARYVLSLKTV